MDEYPRRRQPVLENSLTITPAIVNATASNQTVPPHCHRSRLACASAPSSGRGQIFASWKPEHMRKWTSGSGCGTPAAVAEPDRTPADDRNPSHLNSPRVRRRESARSCPAAKKGSCSRDALPRPVTQSPAPARVRLFAPGLNLLENAFLGGTGYKTSTLCIVSVCPSPVPEHENTVSKSNQK